MCGRFHVDESMALEVNRMVSDLDKRLKREQLEISTGKDIYPSDRAPVLIADYDVQTNTSKPYGKTHNLSSLSNNPSSLNNLNNPSTSKDLTHTVSPHLTGLILPPFTIEMEWQQWGFPGIQSKKLIINARSECAQEKKMFSEGMKYGRIVVPVAWFYEWNRNKEKITFTHKNKPVLYMAGLFNIFDEKKYFVILTTEANSSIKDTHSRMPLILEEEEIRPWIYDEFMAKKILHKQPAPLEKKAEYEQQTFKFL